MQTLLDSLARFRAEPSLEWLSTKVANPPLNIDAIVDEFLQSDLSRTSKPVLVPGDFTLPQLKFSKAALLQIHEIVDITLPSPQRLNLEVSSKPTFKLLLSDGFTLTVAITKGLFPHFSPTLLPGLKIVINSDTMCRFGVIFLESFRNVEIIGGYCEALVDKCVSTLVYDPNRFADSPPPQAPQRPQRPRDMCALSLVPEETNRRPASFLDSDGEDLADLVEEIDPLTSEPLLPTVGVFKNQLLIGQSLVQGSVRTCGLLEIRKRGQMFSFNLDLVIGEQNDVMPVQASSELLECLLKSSARQWLDLLPKEQEKRFISCCKALVAMTPPLKLEVRSPKQVILLPK
jgi:hypothetical protein